MTSPTGISTVDRVSHLTPTLYERSNHHGSPFNATLVLNSGPGRDPGRKNFALSCVITEQGGEEYTSFLAKYPNSNVQSETKHGTVVTEKAFLGLIEAVGGFLSRLGSHPKPIANGVSFEGMDYANMHALEIAMSVVGDKLADFGQDFAEWKKQKHHDVAKLRREFSKVLGVK